MKLIAPILLLLLLSACKQDKPSTANNPDQNTAANLKDARPKVYLEGLYATSGSGEHVFDLDMSQGWKTQGTGTDEGIMLYFARPILLSAIKVTPEKDGLNLHPENPHFNPEIRIYVNGSAVSSGKPDEVLGLGEKPVKSLYVRFVHTGKEQTTVRENTTIETFPENQQIAIQSIQILNDKGEAVLIVPPQQVNGSVTASSTLSPESAYSPANLFDARKEFVWVEGNNSTDGVGETLTFSCDSEVNIDAVEIWNGYQRSADHFKSNARVRDFEFGAEGGVKSTYTLRDDQAGQHIPLSAAAKGRRFQLTIKSVYPGTKYKDMAISEIVFYDGGQPFVIHVNRNSAALTQSTAGTVLSALINHRVSNETVDFIHTNQSIILRADGTFVLYRQEVDQEDPANKVVTSDTYADGNWELISADANTAKVKIFGKWNNLSMMDEYYNTTTPKEISKIFSDILTINKQTLEGQKLVGVFQIR